MFVCSGCKKEFKIRIGKSKLTGIHQERQIDEHQYNKNYGSIIVVENQFAFKQIIPLDLGDNEFGRYVKGTNINKPIETCDPSVDTFHCAIKVEKKKNGGYRYILRDAPSETGTFYMNDILKDVDRVYLEDGAIITIGATTLILRAADGSDSE